MPNLSKTVALIMAAVALLSFSHADDPVTIIPVAEADIEFINQSRATAGLRSLVWVPQLAEESVSTVRSVCMTSERPYDQFYGIYFGIPVAMTETVSANEEMKAAAKEWEASKGKKGKEENDYNLLVNSIKTEIGCGVASCLPYHGTEANKKYIAVVCKYA